MNLIIFLSSKRFLRHYPDLIKNKSIKFIDTNNLFPENKINIKKLDSKIFKKKAFQYILDKWISSYISYKRSIEVKPICKTELNIFHFIYIFLGFLSYKSHFIFEKLFIRYCFLISNNEFIKLIKEENYIILTSLNSYEYLAYFIAKKFNKKIFILPDGYDFARKMPIPLTADKYFSYDLMTTKLYLKYKI